MKTTNKTTKTATKKKAPKPYSYYAVYRFGNYEGGYGYLFRGYTWAKSEIHAINQVRYNDIGFGSNGGYIAVEWDPAKRDAHEYVYDYFE